MSLKPLGKGFASENRRGEVVSKNKLELIYLNRNAGRIVQLAVALIQTS
jgi:hypothetical protein